MKNSNIFQNKETKGGCKALDVEQNKTNFTEMKKVNVNCFENTERKEMNNGRGAEVKNQDAGIVSKIQPKKIATGAVILLGACAAIYGGKKLSGYLKGKFTKTAPAEDDPDFEDPDAQLKDE